MRYSDFCAWADAFTDATCAALEKLNDNWKDFLDQTASFCQGGVSGGSQFFIGPNAPLGANFGTYMGLFNAMKPKHAAFNAAEKVEVDTKGKDYGAIASERIWGE